MLGDVGEQVVVFHVGEEVQVFAVPQQLGLRRRLRRPAFSFSQGWPKLSIGWACFPAGVVAPCRRSRSGRRPSGIRWVVGLFAPGLGAAKAREAGDEARRTGMRAPGESEGGEGANFTVGGWWEGSNKRSLRRRAANAADIKDNWFGEGVRWNRCCAGWLVEVIGRWEFGRKRGSFLRKG